MLFQGYRRTVRFIKKDGQASKLENSSLNREGSRLAGHREHSQERRMNSEHCVDQSMGI